MLRPPFSPTSFNRPRRSSILPIVGSIICSVIFLVLFMMFYNEPIASEEQEISINAVIMMKEHLQEWVAPEIINDRVSLRTATRDQMNYFYRVRVIIALDGFAWLSKHPITAENVDSVLLHWQNTYLKDVKLLFQTLSEANYKNRKFPIDVEVRLIHRPDLWGKGVNVEAAIIGDLIGVLSHFSWHHGRFNILSVRQGEKDVKSTTARESSLTGMSPLEWWIPSSEWEVGVILQQPAVFSKDWLEWLQTAIRHYASSPLDDVNQPWVTPRSREVKNSVEYPIYDHQDALLASNHIRNPTSIHWMGISLSPPLENPKKNLGNDRGNAHFKTLFIQQPGSGVTAFFAKPWKAYTEWWLRRVNEPCQGESCRLSEEETNPLEVSLNPKKSILMRYMLEHQAYLLFLSISDANQVFAANLRAWREGEEKGGDHLEKPHPFLSLAQEGVVARNFRYSQKQMKPEMLLDYALKPVKDESSLPMNIRS